MVQKYGFYHKKQTDMIAYSRNSTVKINFTSVHCLPKMFVFLR